MAVLAMTPFGTLLLTASFVVCIVLVVYALRVLACPPKGETSARRLAWVFLAPLEFAALWLWLKPAIEILLWLFVFGDALNERRINLYARLPATVIAVAASAAVAIRLARGATQRFARIHLWGTILLLGGYAGLDAYDYISRIEGITAQRAAENYAAHCRAQLFPNGRLVERKCDFWYPDDPTRHCYYIMVGNEVRVSFAVYKMGWFAWSVAESKVL